MSECIVNEAGNEGRSVTVVLPTGGETMESIDTLRETVRAAGEKLSQIESAAFRKVNGKKVGKTFKTRNNYSCPEKPSDYWWVYVAVTRMDEFGLLYATEFQTDSRGNIFLRLDQCVFHLQSDYKSIPAIEFHRAAKKMQEKIADAL